MKKVVVLTGNSLLSLGIVSRLREAARQFILDVIDVNLPDCLPKITQIKPDIVIYDESDLKLALTCSFVDLLDCIPNATILELRLDSPNVHLIRSVHIPASNADELIQILNTGSNPSNYAAV